MKNTGKFINRDLFDGLMDAFPDMEEHQHEQASIVVDSTFESAIVKVLRNQPKILTPFDKLDVNH